jgi:hypothetical protein
MISPLSRSQPETSTGMSGGENDVAFSMSSAIRWLMSSAANPARCAWGGSAAIRTRS